MNLFPSIDTKLFYKSLFIAIILPNFFIIAICLIKDPGIVRPFINVDYLVVILLFSFSNKYLKLLGIILFVFFFSIDTLLIALQSLPHNTRINDLLYLLTSLFDGPKQFMYIVLGVLILLVFQLCLLLFFAPKATTRSYLNLTAIILIMKLLLSVFSFPINVINSQFVYFVQNFSQLKTTPEEMRLNVSQERNASHIWFESIKQHKKLPPKLLLIVNESWGVAKNQNAQNNILKKLTAHKNSFEFLNQGVISLESITVYAEFRELCHSTTPNLFYIKNTHLESGYKQCLPYILKQQGYLTISIHANTKIMYERDYWYPLAGFEKSYFGNDINLPKDSYGGLGIFDPNLLPVIAEKFKNNNTLFLYWLTLTSHYPYATNDIKNDRFNCQQFDINPVDACHNLMMQAQFFDALAALTQMPEMKGVEVIVVGDHPPVFVLNKKENYQSIYDNEVPWVHFKIK